MNNVINLQDAIQKLYAELESFGTAKKLLDKEREKTAEVQKANDVTLRKSMAALDGKADELKETSETNITLAGILTPLADKLLYLSNAVDKAGFPDRLDQIHVQISATISAIQTLQANIDKSEQNQLDAIKQSTESIILTLQQMNDGISSRVNTLQERIDAATTAHNIAITETAQNVIGSIENSTTAISANIDKSEQNQLDAIKSYVNTLQEKIDITTASNNKTIVETAKILNNSIENSTTVMTASMETTMNAVKALHQRIDLLEMNNLNAIKVSTSDISGAIAKSGSLLFSQIQSEGNSQRELITKISKLLYITLGISLAGFITSVVIFLNK